MENKTEDHLLPEHRFWLQIMGDHARFVFYGLSPLETGEIRRAQTFIFQFDEMLARARMLPGSAPSGERGSLSRLAYAASCEMRSFLMQLLSLSLCAGVRIALSSSELSQMLGELEEYLRIMAAPGNGAASMPPALYGHLCWFPDAQLHATALAARLDAAQSGWREQSWNFERQFTALCREAFACRGYMRTGLREFPALQRLNRKAAETMGAFLEFLGNIREERRAGAVTGALTPLMADHMAREGEYYLLCLPETVKSGCPEVDPFRPRAED